MSLWTSTLESYLDQVAADTPVPSSGATTAVCANLGLGLLLMALHNTARKEPGSDIQRLIKTVEELKEVLKAHADNDVRTFRAYIDETPERGGHTKQRALDITLGSLAAARSCYEGLCLAERAMGLVHTHVRTDVISAALIMHASLCAMLLNVDSDCSQVESLGDSPVSKATRSALQSEADMTLQRLRRNC